MKAEPPTLPSPQSLPVPPPEPPRDWVYRGDLRLQQGSAGPARQSHKVLQAVVRALFSLLFRVRVIGLDQVPRGQYIVCVNHLGWTDAFLVFLYFPAEPRLYAFGARRAAEMSAWRHKFIDWLSIMIPYDYGRPREALRAAEDVLQRGGSLFMCPEGTLGTREGDLLPLQPGSAHLSLRTGVPLLPVGVTGTLELWLRRPLTLRVGQPIPPSAFEGDLHTRVHTMTRRLDREMRALIPGDTAHPRWKPLRDRLTRLF